MECVEDPERDDAAAFFDFSVCRRMRASVTLALVLPMAASRDRNSSFDDAWRPPPHTSLLHPRSGLSEEVKTHLRICGFLVFVLSMGAVSCATATRFALDLNPAPRTAATLDLHPLYLQSASIVRLTGYGPRTDGAFSASDARVFDRSLLDTLVRNHVFSSVTLSETPSPSADYALSIRLLNHILATDTGGVMEITWDLTGRDLHVNGRFAVYCAYSSAMRIFDCLNRGTVSRLVQDATAPITGRKQDLTRADSGALIFPTAVDAATRLPDSLTTVSCIIWENSIFGPNCTDTVTVTLRNIDWKTYIKEPAGHE